MNAFDPPDGARRNALARLAVGGVLSLSVPVVGAARTPGASDMTEEERANVDAIVRHHEALSTGRVEEAAAHFSDPTHNHGRLVPRSRLLAILGDLRATFPDLSMPVQATVASGPSVVVRARFRGTHDGMGRLPVNGGLMVDVPPTGKRMDVQHIHWYVLKDGLIAERWACRDDIDMMQELGLLPPTKFDPARFAAPK